MTTAERVRQLEDEIEYLKAIVDGSEAQTREAVTCVLGLLMSFLKEKGALDYGELISFLAGAADPNEKSEDHNGRLIHDMRRMMEFHRDLETGQSKPHVPVGELLSDEEMAGITRRAYAQVAFEKVAKEEARSKRVRKTKGARARNATPVH